MWVVHLFFASAGPAWAGGEPVPLVLPPGEDPAAWESAAELAGLRPGARGAGAWVAVERSGDTWNLRVRDASGTLHTVPLPPPRDATGREDAVWLAVSLLDPLGGAAVEPRALPLDARAGSGEGTRAADLPPREAPPQHEAVAPARRPAPAAAPPRPATSGSRTRQPVPGGTGEEHVRNVDPPSPVTDRPPGPAPGPTDPAPSAPPPPATATAAAPTPTPTPTPAPTPAPAPAPASTPTPSAVPATASTPPVPVTETVGTASTLQGSAPAAPVTTSAPRRGVAFPWASASGGAHLRFGATATAQGTLGVGVGWGPGRVGLFVGAETESQFPTLGDTERMSSFELGAGARWRTPGRLALLLGGGAGASARRYLVDTGTVVGTTVIPLVYAEAGLSWAPVRWLEVAPLVRGAFDLGTTTLQKGATIERPAGLAVSLGLDISLRSNTIP